MGLGFFLSTQRSSTDRVSMIYPSHAARSQRKKVANAINARKIGKVYFAECGIDKIESFAPSHDGIEFVYSLENAQFLLLSLNPA